MEKAKRILFTVSGVLSIVGIVLWFILGIAFIVLSNEIKPSADVTPEEADALKALFVVYGGLFIFFAVMSIVNAIICFKAKNSNEKGIMIVSIVFGVLSGIGLNILASIFGLIVRNRKPANTVIEE